MSVRKIKNGNAVVNRITTDSIHVQKFKNNYKF